jgi:hypothetical protein
MPPFEWSRKRILYIVERTPPTKSGTEDEGRRAANRGWTEVRGPAAADGTSRAFDSPVAPPADAYILWQGGARVNRRPESIHFRTCERPGERLPLDVRRPAH